MVDFAIHTIIVKMEDCYNELSELVWKNNEHLIKTNTQLALYAKLLMKERHLNRMLHQQLLSIAKTIETDRKTSTNDKEFMDQDIIAIDEKNGPKN